MDRGAWWAAVHGVMKSRMTEWLHLHFSSYSGEGNGNPLQCSCLENPRDNTAWWAAVYGVAQSRIGLRQPSSSSSISEILLLCINYYPPGNSADFLFLFFFFADFLKLRLGRFLWAGLLSPGETMDVSAQRGALGVFLSLRDLVSKTGDKRTLCQPWDFLLTSGLKSKPSACGLCWT